MSDDELVKTLFAAKLLTMGLVLKPNGDILEGDTHVARYVGWVKCQKGYDVKFELLNPVQTLHIRNIDAHEIGISLPDDEGLHTIH